MIEYNDALSLLKQFPVQAETTNVDALNSLGLVASAPILAKYPVPRFRNSAMDGFALRSQDFKSQGRQTTLRQIATTMAGCETLQVDDYANTCMEVMTGAVVNDAYDAVIPVEQIQTRDDERIQFSMIPKPFDNLRKIGEDFAEGDVIIEKNQRINPQHLMALSAFNEQSIEVYKPLKTSVIATGKELVQGERTSNVQIHDSNSPYLKAKLSTLPLDVNPEVIKLDDDIAAFCDHMQKLMQTNQVIISTGAVSAGKLDFIPLALSKLGAEIIFHKVAIRPGKPVLFATLPNGGVYFGLPGNPISCAVGFRFFIKPFIDACFQLTDEKPLMARLDNDFELKKALTFFLKSHYYTDEQGLLKVNILPGQESFKIAPLVKANAFTKHCHSKRHYKKGDLIPVYPMDQ
jgi:molybdopterin molybdotransferase